MQINGFNTAWSRFMELMNFDRPPTWLLRQLCLRCYRQQASFECRPTPVMHYRTDRLVCSCHKECFQHILTVILLSDDKLSRWYSRIACNLEYSILSDLSALAHWTVTKCGKYILSLLLLKSTVCSTNNYNLNIYFLQRSVFYSDPFQLLRNSVI